MFMCASQKEQPLYSRVMYFKLQPLNIESIPHVPVYLYVVKWARRYAKIVCLGFEIFEQRMKKNYSINTPPSIYVLYVYVSATGERDV